MLDQVTEALAALETGGAFATELTLSSKDLKLEVDGVGPVRFPITASTARKLCAVTRPAPFGRGARTLHDRRVRDTGEIDESKIGIEGDAWDNVLAPQLAILQERLGLPADGTLEAVFDKMLVYGPGQFFATHQDSERDDTMIASLVVELPSAHEGGALVVEHRGKTQTFSRASLGPKELGLFAFYADCHHEVKPVTSGYRVTLSYQLLFRQGRASKKRKAPDANAIARLEASVKAYFATPVVPRYSTTAPQPPDRLVYLLDHEYTQKSLGWEHLKNGDRLRAGALRQVAERLDCEVFLALADVHESWSCEEDDDRRGRYGRRYDRRYDEPAKERDAEEYELYELIDADMELRHWVGAEGKPSEGTPLRPSTSEICFTRPSDEMAPWKSEHEGNMGNYGNTVDRWYHRAALVMWPKERSFVLRARVSPEGAVKEVAAQIKKGAVEEARASAKSLVPFWREVAPAQTGAPFVTALLGMLTSLDDADLSHALLAPLGPTRLVPSVTPRFAALIERFGLIWAQKLFSTWTEKRRYDQPELWKDLPRLSVALSAGGPQGEALARWLLTGETAKLRQEYTSWIAWSEVRRQSGDGEIVPHLLSVLETAALIRQPMIRDELLTLLTTKATALPLTTAGTLLQMGQKGREPIAVRELGLGALYDHLVGALEAAIAAPERALDDWSIAPPGKCSCALCTELASFLQDKSRIHFAWPLAKERRQHVHGVIDGHGLPVTHVTLRQGRPLTLVLTKQNTLFERERALRAKQQKLLAWLREERGTFKSNA